MKRLRSETQKEKKDKTAKKAKYKANREAKRIAKLQELINNNSKHSIGPSGIVDPSSSSARAPTSIVDHQFISDYVPTQANCDTLPITVDPPVTNNDPIMHVNENPVMSPPVVSLSQAELHPVLKNPLKVKPPIFESRTSTVIAELRNQKVFNLSYNELIALSSKAHTEFRRPLVSKTQLENDGVKDISDLLLNQEVELPEGNHAPRTIGQINGIQVNVILDTGCTPCVIISYHLVQKLGLADKMISLPKSSNGGILVGDGRRVQIKEIAKNLELQLLPGHARPIDAVCLDVPDSAYEFLCGRIVMAQFGICVDLGTSSWFIRNGKELDEMEVLHTAPDVDQGTDTCYLVNVQSVQAVQSVQSETTSVQENAKSSGLEMFDKLFADIDSNPLLSKKQQLEIKQLILSKSKAFGIGYSDLTQTNLVKFHVDTGNAKPVYKRPYGNMSFSELETLQKEIADMLEAGTLIPAMHSGEEAPYLGWFFQVMYVPKKNGEKRLVTMFQDLNKVTIADPWSLPNITTLLESFGNSTYLSSLDLLKGFNQIACDQETIPKLQISAPFGAYCYTVMPFGVRNGPSTFSRAINLALRDFNFCTTYIDDNQVFSKSYEVQ